MNKKILWGLLACVLTMQLDASPVDIMVGARGFGFGGAYSAIVNDPSAAYWNPAALTQVPHISIMGSNWYFQEISGLNVSYLNFTMPISKLGTVSGSWLLNYAKLEQFGSIENGEVALQSNSSYEHTLSLSIGRKLWDELGPFDQTSIGFSVNRIHFVSSGGKESGLGIDLGLYTKFPLGFSMAMVGRSLLSDVGGMSLDPEARLGLGYTTTLQEIHRLTVGLDGAYKMNRDYNEGEPAYHNMKYFGGLEYALLYEDWILAVRGGGNGTLISTLENFGFNAGIGITYSAYSLQYAFKGDTKPEAGLGYSHRADLVFEIGRLLTSSEIAD